MPDNPLFRREDRKREPEIKVGVERAAGAETNRTDFERNVSGSLGGRPAVRDTSSRLEPEVRENAAGADRLRFRGVGPRGYTKSDARIHEQVSDGLADDGELDASDMEVLVRGGEVTLNGYVWSRQDKRRAEDIADTIAGVVHVQNNLRVKHPR